MQAALGLVFIQLIFTQQGAEPSDITEWPRLEETSGIINLQPSHHRQGNQLPHLMLDQAAQGPIQPGLELLTGWTGHPEPLRAAVPGPHHSHSKELKKIKFLRFL